MLALAHIEAVTCGRCGGDLAETTDPAHEDAYRPQPPVQCHRCAALAMSEATYRDHPHAGSLMHIVQLKRG